MKIKSQRDFWAGLMFIAVGIGFAWGATGYSFGASARPGPGYFPFGLGILLAILGAMVLFTAMTIEVEGGDPVGHFAWRPLAIIVASIVIYGFAQIYLGLFVALPLLVMISSWAGDEFHWGEALANSVVLTAASWVIFIYGLNLTIPLWPVFMAH